MGIKHGLVVAALGLAILGTGCASMNPFGGGRSSSVSPTSYAFNRTAPPAASAPTTMKARAAA